MVKSLLSWRRAFTIEQALFLVLRSGDRACGLRSAPSMGKRCAVVLEIPSG
jgi:hypothetical protein